MNDHSAAFILESLLLSAGLLVFTKLLSKLTVIETTVQLNTDSASGGSGEESLFSGLEASILSSNDGSTSSPRGGGGGGGGRAGDLLDDDEDGSFDDTSDSTSRLPRAPSVSRPGLGHSEASTRHFLQFSGFRSMIWNLCVYLTAYATVFIVLMSWRVLYAPTAEPGH